MKVVSKRKKWIDIVKGLAMMSVVYFHINSCFVVFNYNVDSYLKVLFSMSEVILFFLVSGFTLVEVKLASTKDFLTHKIKTLYVRVMMILIPTVLLHNVFIELGLYKLDMEYDGKVMYRYQIADFAKQCIFTLFGACREVMTGPMWFANVLLFALILNAFIAFVVNHIFVNNRREYRLLVCFLLMLLSSFLTNICEFTIPRGNNTLTAVFLIDLGQYLYFYKKETFHNKIIIIASFALLIILPFYGNVGLNRNEFVGPSYLIAVAISSMYVVSHIAKIIENMWLGRLVAFVGRYSFYIMAFQFLGFRIASLLLGCLSDEREYLVYELIPTAENGVETIVYFLVAIMFSLVLGIIIERILHVLPLVNCRKKNS